MDDLRVFRGALSADEVAIVFRERDTRPPPGPAGGGDDAEDVLLVKVGRLLVGYDAAIVRRRAPADISNRWRPPPTSSLIGVTPTRLPSASTVACPGLESKFTMAIEGVAARTPENCRTPMNSASATAMIANTIKAVCFQRGPAAPGSAGGSASRS